MGYKEKKAKEYSDKQPLFVYEYVEEAFKAGWDAALDYFSSLPFDKMLEEFDKYFNEKEEKE